MLRCDSADESRRVLRLYPRVVARVTMLGMHCANCGLWVELPPNDGLHFVTRVSDDTYLIRHSHPDEQALGRLHINMGELTARAHERGFDDLAEVDTAVLYPNGTIYMKGCAPSDSVQLAEIRRELAALRQDVAGLK